MGISGSPHEADLEAEPKDIVGRGGDVDDDREEKSFLPRLYLREVEDSFKETDTIMSRLSNLQIVDEQEQNPNS